MKRIVLFLALMTAGMSLAAQEPIVPEREVVVIDNFTSVPQISLGLYQYARQCVIDGLARRRVVAVDVETNGYGRPDIVYPSFPKARPNNGSPFDLNRAQNLMKDFQMARYYLTAYICRFGSHPVEHKSKDKEGNPVIRTDFTGDIELDVWLYDSETSMVEGPIRWKYSYTGAPDPIIAEEKAVSNIGMRARQFVTDRFRIKASVIQMGEYNRKGKLQDLFLSCGSDIDVEKGDVFFVYEVSNINGIQTARKLGKVKAREITGPESCRCSVSNGEIEIDRAFRAGELLIAVSDDDRWF
ncbi:MAG: hypothetical protein J6Z44_04510 [Bacteroidales bacterium]|nr:hypothetical protein [Bacteroidales bacterium]